MPIPDMPALRKKMIHVYTGNGGGKTTAALGIAMRSLGHGHKVVMIQFMKGRKNIGEYKIQNRLKSFRVYQFGRKELIRPITNLKNADYALAKKGLKCIEQVLDKEKPYLLILDEVNLAAAIGLLEPKDVLKALEKANGRTYIIMTGRKAPREFIEKATIVTEVNDTKRKSISARKGIEY